jgi:hypothetical protein
MNGFAHKTHDGRSTAMSTADVARRMGCSETTVHNVEARALAKIRMGLLNDPDVVEMLAEMYGEASVGEFHRGSLLHWAANARLRRRGA